MLGSQNWMSALGSLGGLVGGGLNTVQDIFATIARNKLAGVGRQGMLDTADSFTKQMMQLGSNTEGQVKAAQERGTVANANNLNSQLSNWFGIGVSPLEQPGGAAAPISERGIKTVNRGNQAQKADVISQLMGIDNTNIPPGIAGVETGGPMNEAGQPSTNVQSALDILRSNLAGASDAFASGNGLLTRSMTGQVGNQIADATTAEQARVDQIKAALDQQQAGMQAEHDQIVAQARGDLESTKATLTDNLAKLTDMVKGGMDVASKNFADTLTSLKDTAAQALIGTGAAAWASISTTVKELSKQLTGDPQRDAQVQRQIAAAKAGAVGKATQQMQETRAQSDNFSATVREQATATLNTANGTFTNVLSNAQTGFGANLNNAIGNYEKAQADANQNLNYGKVNLSNAFVTASNQMSQALTQLRGVGLAQIGQAVLGDGAMLKSMYDGLNALTSGAAADAVGRINDLGQVFATAIASGAQLQANAFMTFVNPNVFTANFMQGADWLFNAGQTVARTQAQIDQADASQQQAQTGTWMPFAQTALNKI